MKPVTLQWIRRIPSRQWSQHWEKWNNELMVNCLPVLYGGIDSITQNILVTLIGAVVKLISAAKFKMLMGITVPAVSMLKLKISMVLVFTTAAFLYKKYFREQPARLLAHLAQQLYAIRYRYGYTMRLRRCA